MGSECSPALCSPVLVTELTPGEHLAQPVLVGSHGVCCPHQTHHTNSSNDNGDEAEKDKCHVLRNK